MSDEYECTLLCCVSLLSPTIACSSHPLDAMVLTSDHLSSAALQVIEVDGSGADGAANVAPVLQALQKQQETSR